MSPVLRSVLPLLVLGLFLARPCRGQSCKFKIDKTDPITGEHLVAEGILLKPGLSIGLGKTGDRPEMAVTIYLGGEQNFTAQPGNIMTVKLANGDTLQRANMNTCAPSTNVLYDKVTTIYTLVYHVGPRFYEALAGQAVTYFRFMINELQIDAEVNGKDAKRILKYAECLK